MVPNNQRKRAPKNRRRRPARPAPSGRKTHLVALLGACAAIGALLWLGDGFEAQSATTATLFAEAPELTAPPVTPLEPAPAESPDTDRIEGELGPGETLSQALRDRGLETARIQEIIEALRHEFDFRFSRAGDTFLLITARGAGTLLSFEYRRGPLEVYAITRDDRGALLSFQKATAGHGEPRASTLTATPSLSGVLARDAGGAQLAESLWEVFGAELNLYELPAGTALSLQQEDSEGRARLIAARLTPPEGATRHALYYIDPEGRGAYVDETGRYLGAPYLQSPFKFAALSAEAPHLGDDKKTYTAAPGTPLVAVADGTISAAGPRGTAGNVIELSFPDGSRAIYQNLAKLAPGLKEGVLVNQGRALGVSRAEATFWIERDKKIIPLGTLSKPHRETIPARHREHFAMFLREHLASLRPE